MGKSNSNKEKDNQDQVSIKDQSLEQFLYRYYIGSEKEKGESQSNRINKEVGIILSLSFDRLMFNVVIQKLKHG